MEEIMILISVIPLQSRYNMMTTTTPIIMRSPNKTIKQIIVVGLICTSVSLTILVNYNQIAGKRNFYNQIFDILISM